MSGSFSPRLSDAQRFLPLLRAHLIASTTRYPLPAGLKIDLLPIAEDGLFGYELVPDRKAHTYVTIGCNARGEPMLRKTLYGDCAHNALQLVSVDGRVRPKLERRERYGTRHRDTRFPDWTAAAEAAWAQLVVLYPGRPRAPIVVREHAQRCLDAAIAIAHSYLREWDPRIHFFGVPNEANLGFGLTGTRTQRGELVFQRPDIWMLRWKAPPQAVYESWSVDLPDSDTTSEATDLNRAS